MKLLGNVQEVLYKIDHWIMPGFYMGCQILKMIYPFSYISVFKSLSHSLSSVILKASLCGKWVTFSVAQLVTDFFRLKFVSCFLY